MILGKSTGMNAICLFLFLLTSCSDDNKDAGNDDLKGMANVISVSATGEPGSYTFSVGINSPDKGCDQYADWWEVVSSDEKLLYRRILAHSHIDEQPFVRSGGPVAIEADEEVWIRAHMNNSGYGGDTFKGSVKNGFSKAAAPEKFALALEKQDPLPGPCPF